MGESDLSGRWTGVFFYPVDPELNPDDAYPPTAFSATLVDVNGHISGSTTEPDIQSPTAAHIQATLDGYRERTHVFFTKFPQGRQTHTIDYHGDIAPDGNAISGTWTIYGEWSGPFLMQRGDGSALKSVVREAHVGG